MSKIPDEERQSLFTHTSAGPINAIVGDNAKQKNNTNSGSGKQYNGEKQYFGRDHGEDSS